MKQFFSYEKKFSRNTNNPREFFLTKLREVCLPEIMINNMKSVMEFKKKIIFEGEIYNLYKNENSWKIFPMVYKNPDNVKTFVLANLQEFNLKGFEFFSGTEFRAVLEIRGQELFTQNFHLEVSSGPEGAYEMLNKIKMKNLKFVKKVFLKRK